MPNRYRLKGASLEEIRRKAEQQHGPAARVVSAERVISPGIAGLFAGDRYEAIVEVLPGREVVSGEVVPDPDILTGAGAEAAPTDPGAGARARPRKGAETGAGEGRAATQDSGTGPTAASGSRSAGSGPDPVPAAAALPSHRLEGAAIALLLEEADAAERDLHRPGGTGVSTESADFAELLEQLRAGLQPAGTGTGTGPGAAAAASDAAAAAAPGAGAAAGAAVSATGGRDAAASDAAAAPGMPSGPLPAHRDAGQRAAPVARPAPEPVLMSGVGDLVVLVGLGEDALDAALAMSLAVGGADVRTAGKLSAYGHLHVDGRQSATAARASAVLTDRTVLVAFGLGKARDSLARLPSIAAISADQLWVVVDAGRKHEDTARWVAVLAAQLNVTAVAVVGAEETATPETVQGLGLPVGWVDSGGSGAPGRTGAHAPADPRSGIRPQLPLRRVD